MSESKEKQYALRLPVELYAELERWAGEEMRSVNAQIVTILRGAVRQRKAGQHGSGQEGYTTEDIETSELEEVPA